MRQACLTKRIINMKNYVEDLLYSNENVHHIFTIPEVRDKIIKIFGEPEKDEDYLLISHEVRWAWSNMPRYKLPVNKHHILHKNGYFGIKPRELKYAILDAERKSNKNKILNEKLIASRERIEELLSTIKFLRNRIKELENKN